MFIKILLTIFVFLSLLEVSIRAKLNYFPPRGKKLDAIVKYDEKLGWDLEQLPLIEKSTRWIALGDSFTHGDGVERTEAWPTLLSNTSNQGVPAYGLDQMYLKYLKLASQFEGEVILLGLIEDDLLRTAKGNFSHTGHQKPYFDLELNLRNYPVEKYDYSESYFDWKMFSHTYYSEVFNILVKDKLRVDRGYKISKKIIEDLSKRIKMSGKELYVVLLGYYEWEDFYKYLKNKNIKAIDCKGYFDLPNFAVSKEDGHPNPKSHRWIADCVKKSIEKN